MSFAKETEVARSAARKAADLAMGYQAAGLRPQIKPDDSPVTIADRECERLIAQALEEAFPEDGLLGEEGASKESRNGRRWIIDPIDGTRDFIRGLPLWCVMIALEEHGEIKAGAVHLPMFGHTYWASRGDGAYRNGVRLKASSISDPAQAVLCLNGLNRMGGHADPVQVLKWAQPFWAIRSLGGTPDAMLVAAGEADVWIEPQVAAWDLAAPQVILEEAGALFFDFRGQRTIYGKSGIGCAPGMERAVRGLLHAE